MHTASATREIDAPRAAVWAALDDFGGVASYNPNVESSGIIRGPETGVGATRECELSGGTRIEEAIIEYEPGASYTVEFVDLGDFPLVENVVEISVEERAPDRTAVTMTAHFTPKYGPLGWVVAKAMMERRFRSTFETTLAGLDGYVRSGQRATPR